MSILFIAILMIKFCLAAALVYGFFVYVFPFLVIALLAVLGVGLVVGLIALLAHLGG